MITSIVLTTFTRWISDESVSQEFSYSPLNEDMKMVKTITILVCMYIICYWGDTYPKLQQK